MRKDLVASALLLLIAAGYYAASLQIPQSTLGDEDIVGARGLPTVLSAIMAILALAIGARALLAKPAIVSAEAEEKAATAKKDEAPWLRALGLLGLVALYLPLAMVAGYFVALFIVISSVAMYEGLQPSPKLFIVALCGAGFFWLLFVEVLGVRQPTGMLF